MKTATLPAPWGVPQVDTVLLAVSVPTPFKIVGDSDFRWAPRGTIYRRHYRIERGGFDGPIEISLADRQARHLQGVTGPTITVPPGESEFDYWVKLPPWMETGRTSRSVIVGVGVIKDTDGSAHEVSFSSVQANEQVVAVIEPGRLGVETEQSSIGVSPGETVSVPVRVSRGKNLSGPVTVQLVVPAHLQGIMADAVEVAADQSDAALAIHCGAEMPNVVACPLIVRATLMDHGEPVVAETKLEISPHR